MSLLLTLLRNMGHMSELLICLRKAMLCDGCLHRTVSVSSQAHVRKRRATAVSNRQQHAACRLSRSERGTHRTAVTCDINNGWSTSRGSTWSSTWQMQCKRSRDAFASGKSVIIGCSATHPVPHIAYVSTYSTCCSFVRVSQRAQRLGCFMLHHLSGIPYLIRRVTMSSSRHSRIQNSGGKTPKTKPCVQRHTARDVRDEFSFIKRAATPIVASSDSSETKMPRSLRDTEMTA